MTQRNKITTTVYETYFIDLFKAMKKKKKSQWLLIFLTYPINPTEGFLPFNMRLGWMDMEDLANIFHYFMYIS